MSDNRNLPSARWASLALFAGGVPTLLVALGLIMLYPRLASGANRLVQVGYALALIGLIIPAGFDLFVWGALGPPFLVPVVGAGLVILALGNWNNAPLQRERRYILIMIGVLQVIAFALALVPSDISDPIGGYRIFGIFAYLLSGLGWATLGASLWKIDQ